VQISDWRGDRFVWSDSWWFDIAQPSFQSLAQQNCANYTRAYQEAPGASRLYLEFLLGEIARWC
jgi:hypothetical protein